jgi:hypothetical protein
MYEYETSETLNEKPKVLNMAPTALNRMAPTASNRMAPTALNRMAPTALNRMAPTASNKSLCMIYEK